VSIFISRQTTLSSIACGPSSIGAIGLCPPLSNFEMGGLLAHCPAPLWYRLAAG
jgi:hypothetical protein